MLTAIIIREQPKKKNFNIDGILTLYFNQTPVFFANTKELPPVKINPLQEGQYNLIIDPINQELTLTFPTNNPTLPKLIIGNIKNKNKNDIKLGYECKYRFYSIPLTLKYFLNAAIKYNPNVNPNKPIIDSIPLHIYNYNNPQTEIPYLNLQKLLTKYPKILYTFAFPYNKSLKTRSNSINKIILDPNITTNDKLTLILALNSFKPKPSPIKLTNQKNTYTI